MKAKRINQSDIPLNLLRQQIVLESRTYLALKEKPMTQTQLRDKLGVSNRTLNYDIFKLKKQKLIEVFLCPHCERGIYYRIVPR